MKIYYLSAVLFIFLVFNIDNLSANSKDTIYVASENKILSEAIGPDYTIIKVDKGPKFAGGREKLEEFIEKNIRYPENINTELLANTSVYLKFAITEGGAVKDISVLKGLTPELDAEAVRVISSLPKMKPGQKDGKAVTMVVSYKFKFKEISLKQTYVDVLPTFPGGEDAMERYLRFNLKYPKEDQENKQEGKVKVRFLVDKTGKLKNIEVVSGISKSLDAEAVRVISKMPAWNPGTQNGKPVPVYFTIPIIFKMKESDEIRPPQRSGSQRDIRGGRVR